MPVEIGLATLPAPITHRLLVVDDHRDTAAVFTRLLRVYGYDAVAAYSCAEAIALCHDQNFHLLITDIGLQDGDGHELFRTLHARHGLKGIAFSGHVADEDVSKALARGFSAYIKKPALMTTMLVAIEEALGIAVPLTAAAARTRPNRRGFSPTSPRPAMPA